MAKKAASKKRATTKTKRKVTKSKKGRTTKIKYHSTKEIKVEKALMDNFIGLQKVMVNLSSKFDNLANQISKLLELFEISARAMAVKDFSAEKENKESKQIIEKLDKISEHAGLIGKGLVLIHEAGQGLSPPPPEPEIKRAPLTRELPEPGIKRAPPIRAPLKSEIVRTPPINPVMPRPQQRKTQEIGVQRPISPGPRKEKKFSEEENAKTNF